MAILEGMVTKPDLVNFGISSSRFDLEVIIKVAKEDEQVFSEIVCVSLANLISSVTGLPKPIVYLYNAPYPAVAKLISYADMHL